METYRERLPESLQAALDDFNAAYPGLDPTAYQDFHSAILLQRQRYGDELDERESAEFTAWLQRMEPMQSALVVARAEFTGLAVSGRDESGRAFTLIGFDGVKPLYSTTQNAAAAESTGVNLVRMNAAYDPLVGDAVNGAGLYVNVNDHGEIYDENPEFQLPGGGNKIVLVEVPGYTDGDRSHMTHVAGTVGAWGYTASVMGMAPRVWIRSHIQQYTSDITGYGMLYPGQLNGTANPVTGEVEMKSVMGTTSLGNNDTNTSKGVYTATSASFDSTLRDYPYYIHFYAAVNNGPSYATLGTDWPVAKNLVTIGSVSDTVRDDNGNYTGGGNISGFSSRGPTFDGRVKPDLTANGEGLTSPSSATGTGSKSGTSMATPNASGSTTLLIDYINTKFPGHFWRSSTLKALLVNTATDRGNAGPDYYYGHGIINVKAAADSVKRYAAVPATRVVLEDVLASGETWTSTYTYDGTGPIRATLCWLDPAGAAQATTTTDRTPRLINDLDIRLVSQGGTTYFPYVMPFTTGNGTYAAYDANLYGAAATTGDNFTDNAEHVYIAAPPAGTYTVQVTHSGTLSGGSQRFSLAVSGMAATAPVAPTIGSVSPAVGDSTNNFQFTVNGGGFLLGSNVILRRDGSNDVTAYGVIILDHQIQCRLDTAGLALGYWDVVVRAPDGTETALPNGFLLPAEGGLGTQVLYSNTFEAGATGLTLEAGWEVGAPNEGGAGGPAAAYSPANVLGTYLSGNYPSNVTINATLPPVSTVNKQNITLNFRRWLGVFVKNTGNPKSYDYARIYYSTNGTTWTQLWSSPDNISTNDGAWTAQSVVLPAAAANQAELHVRFQLQTDSTDVSYGWNIDDVQVTGEGTSVLLPPVFTSTPVETATAGQPYSYTVTASDADTAASVLVLSAAGLPAGLTFTPAGDGTGSITGAPSASGTATVTLSVTDGTYTTHQVFDLVVMPSGGNNPPVITTTSLPQGHVGVAYAATVAATDVDGHAIDLSIGLKPAWMTFTDNGDGTATLGGTPPAGSDGTTEITLTASDGFATDEAVLQLLVSPRAVVALSSAAYSVNEGAGAVTITVSRTLNSTGAVTVNYTTSGGTAASGLDYTGTSGTLSWTDGQTGSRTFQVAIVDDALTEGSQAFSVSLSGVTGIASLGTSSATVTITDNDNNVAPAATITSPSGAVHLPERTNILHLSGQFSDDGKPAWGAVTTTWAQVEGPAGQTVTLANPGALQTVATFPADGAYKLRLTVSDGEFSGTADVRVLVGTAAAPVAGTGVVRDYFSGITGSNVSDLTSSAKFINNLPDSTTTLASLFESPSNAADNYGQRVRGYFIPAQTGSHTFVIASDDKSELWLSTSADPAAKVKIASVLTFTSSRQWTKEANQTSAPVALTAGQLYYIEALMKEGTGGDNLAVGVTFPDATAEQPVTAARLAVFVDIPSNAAPVVDPGPAPQAVAGVAAALDGAALDDGDPAGSTLTSFWSKVSGPGTVTFGLASDPATTVTFSAPGSYVLRLGATDGVSEVHEDLVVLVDEDPYASWMSGYPSASPQDGLLDDPDADGVLNILEFALAGGDPTVADTSVLPEVSIASVDGSDYLVLTVSKNSAANGIIYTVEVGNDLAGWGSGLGHTVLVFEDTGTLVVRDATPMTPATSPRFIRLSVGY